MIKGIYQNCYTNYCREIDGQMVSGWQSVATSPELPEELLKKCSSFQVANSGITSSPRNENGEILTLTELMGDGKEFYFIRTRFGLQDRMGRANMFSHGFMFPAEEVLKNPNLLCSFSAENFRESKEEAEEPGERIAAAPFTASSAMARLGMDGEALKKLVRAVYYETTDPRKREEPLYVQYDGTFDSLRALLYLLFITLPFRVLTGLRVGTHGTVGTVGKNLIFSEKAGEAGCYFIPATGENNILSERIEKRIARLLFVDKPAELRDDEKKSIEFREKITERARILGDSGGSSELTMKLAMEMEEGTELTALSEQELLLRFSDALRTPTAGNEAADRYIAALFGEIGKRGIALTEQNEDDLYMRLPESRVPEFAERIRGYLTEKLSRMSFDEAVTEFGALSPLNRQAVLPVFEKDEEKREAPDRFYAGKYWEGETVTYDALSEFAEKIRGLSIRREAEDCLREKALALYTKDLRKSRRPEQALKAYTGLLKRAFPAVNSGSTEEEAKKLFWENATYLRLNELEPESILSFRGTETEKEKHFTEYNRLRTLLKEKRYDDFFQAFPALSEESRINPQGTGESLQKALFQGLTEAEDWYAERTAPGKPEKKGLFSLFRKKN